MVGLRQALLLSGLLLVAGSAETTSSPNFLVLFVDVRLQHTVDIDIDSLTPIGILTALTILTTVQDMGYGDLSCNGAPTTLTPNIDAFATEGTMFTQWYSAHAICTPSRAAMVTGRLPIRNGLCGNDKGPQKDQGVFSCSAKYGLPQNETTFATLLKKSSKNYKTGMLGKWHLGQKDEFMPFSHGFDYYLGVPYSVDMGLAYGNTSAESDFEVPSQGGYYGCNPLPLVENNTILEQPTDLTNLTMRYTNAAAEFMTSAVNEKTPFLLYVAFGHVHTPQYAAADRAGTSKRGVFGDSVEELDAAVGDIMRTVKTLGIDQNTVVFFTSVRHRSSRLLSLPLPPSLRSLSRRSRHHRTTVPPMHTNTTLIGSPSPSPPTDPTALSSAVKLVPGKAASVNLALCGDLVLESRLGTGALRPCPPSISSPRSWTWQQCPCPQTASTTPTPWYRSSPPRL
jgi:hypothetical protein